MHGAWAAEAALVAVADLVKDGKEPAPGRIVAALTFSFWTAMTGPTYEELWRSTLNAIAIKRDGKLLMRKHLSRPLLPIRVLRWNRVAHHEPILHWDLHKHHANITEITSSLSPAAAAWCQSISRFSAVYPVNGYTLVKDTAAEITSPKAKR